MAITFLSIAEVMAIHEDMIHRYGGSLGLRDLPLLESAVGMPEATFGGQYLHDGIPSMAAAYCFHLVANHPFIDGNKRVGAAAANVFLEMKGWALDSDNDSYAEFVPGVASGRIDNREATSFFELHSRSLSR
jgi:death-on-curing protein